MDLEYTHRLLGAEIAIVRRLDIGDVRRLGNQGLAALAAPGRRAAGRSRPTPAGALMEPDLVSAFVTASDVTVGILLGIGATLLGVEISDLARRR